MIPTSMSTINERKHGFNILFKHLVTLCKTPSCNVNTILLEFFKSDINSGNSLPIMPTVG